MKLNLFGAELPEMSPLSRPVAFEGAPSAHSGISLHHSSRSSGHIRTCFGFILILFIVLAGKVAAMQIGQGAYYSSLSEDNRSRIEAIPAERGGVFDRYGVPLLHNVPDFQVRVIPGDLPKDAQLRRDIFLRLAQTLELQPEDIESKLQEFRLYPTSPVTIATGLTQEQAVKIGVMAADIPSVTLVSGMRREYSSLKEALSLAHVVGYTGRITQPELDTLGRVGYGPSDVVGKSGIEKQYETALRGTFGKRRTERDVRGVAQTVIAEDPPVKGADLTLSLDFGLQKKIEEVMNTSLKGTGLRRVSVVALSPMTGEVLALVSLPSFDATSFAKGVSSKEYAALLADPDHPLFPRAVSGSLPSGSTFKMVVASAALEERVISTATTVLSSGGIHVGQWFFPDWKAGGHGVTNVVKALAESVNTFFYIVGGGYEDRAGLGNERIIDYAAKFGFGSQTGIDLPREGAGFLPTPEWKEKLKNEKWYIGDTYHLAIGQGDLLVTPLQIATMTSVFANGGKLIRPSLLLSMAQDGKPRLSHEPDVVNPQVVSPETIAVVRRGMLETTRSGSARGQLGTLPFSVAAKTGTAEWNSRKATHAWITMFAPYENPQITLTIVLEEGGQGSDIPQRMAKEILAWYLSER